MNITAIIPAYNEEDIIWHLIAYLVNQGIHVHLLDNESTDRTIKIARSFPNDAVTISSFSTGGLFHAKLYDDAIRAVIANTNADWILKNDADEFIETPWEEVSLAAGIRLADRHGYDCIGVASYQFYPMSDESPHLPGTDVREYYDHCKLWDQVDRWSPDLHPRYKELWKINIFKNRPGVTIVNSHRLHLPDGLAVHLFPELFELRHYPYREPARTYQRLVRERRDRMAHYNLEHSVYNHYAKYSDDSAYVRNHFLFDDIRAECIRWSQRRRPAIQQSWR